MQDSTAERGARAPTEAGYPSQVYAWWVVIVLTLALLVSFIDRHIVSLLVEPIKLDLRINDAQAGWLFGGFAIFHAVAGLPLARLADRKSRRMIITLGILSWSLMTVACGVARNFWQLFAARIGVGVGEATLSPAANSLVCDFFPRNRIPLALSVFQIGAVVGSGLAFLLGGLVVEYARSSPPVDVPFVGTLRAWQLTFIYVGAPGILVVLLMATVREPVRRLFRNSDGVQQDKASIRDIVAFYRLNWLTFFCHHVGISCISLMGWAFIFWTPTFFQRVHGIPAGQAAQLLGLSMMIFGTLGVFLAAFIAHRLSLRGRKDANMFAMIVGAAGIGPTIILIQLVPNIELIWLLYMPAMAFVNMHGGLAHATLPLMTPPHMRAQIAAIYTVVASLFGMGIGPVIAGAINDHIFTGPDGVRYSLMLIAAVFGPLAVGLIWLGCKPYARSLVRAEAQASMS